MNSPLVKPGGILLGRCDKGVSRASSSVSIRHKSDMGGLVILLAFKGLQDALRLCVFGDTLTTATANREIQR